MYQCISIYITCIQIKYIWNRCSIIPNYTPIYFVYTFCTLVLYAQGLRPCHGRFKIDSIITSEVSRMEVFQNMFFFNVFWYDSDMICCFDLFLAWFCSYDFDTVQLWLWYGFSCDSWCGSNLFWWGLGCFHESWDVFYWRMSPVHLIGLL